MAHAARWAAVWEKVKDLPVDGVVLYWTKSHVTVEYQVAHQIPQHVLTGNECADALAKRGAELARIRPAQLAQVRCFDLKAAKVRRRLLAVQELVLAECGPDRAEEEAGRDRAAATRRRRGVKHKAGGNWIRDDPVEPLPPCPPPPAAATGQQEEEAPGPTSPDVSRRASSDVTRERREQVIAAVRAKAHPSHDLAGNLEVVWCTACCSVTSVSKGRLTLLAKPCRRKATERARSRVDGLERGLNPLANDRAQKRRRSERLLESG